MFQMFHRFVKQFMFHFVSKVSRALQKQSGLASPGLLCGHRNESRQGIRIRRGRSEKINNLNLNNCVEFI